MRMRCGNGVTVHRAAKVREIVPTVMVPGIFELSKVVWRAVVHAAADGEPVPL